MGERVRVIWCESAVMIARRKSCPGAPYGRHHKKVTPRQLDPIPEKSLNNPACLNPKAIAESKAVAQQIYHDIIAELRQPVPPTRPHRGPLRPRANSLIGIEPQQPQKPKEPRRRRSLDDRRAVRRRPVQPGVQQAHTGCVISRRDFLLMAKLFESIDSDHSNNLDLVEYTKNVKKIAPSCEGMAADMFELLAQGRDNVGLVDFVQAGFPLVPREELERLKLKYFPPKVEAPRLTALEKLTELQINEIRAIAKNWDRAGEGRITQAEMRQRCMPLQIGDDMLDAWFLQYDEGGKGALTIDEVVACLAECYATDD